MSSKKKCLLCGAEVDHDHTHCHICGHDQFEEIEEETEEEAEEEIEEETEEDSSDSEGGQEALDIPDPSRSKIYKDCKYCTYEVHETLSICPACGSNEFAYPHMYANGNEGHSYTSTEGSAEPEEVYQEGDYLGYEYKNCTRCKHSLPGMVDGEVLLICPVCGHDKFTSPNPLFNTPDSAETKEDALPGEEIIHIDDSDEEEAVAENPLIDHVDLNEVIGDADPTEGDSSELDIEVEPDPVFCSYLKNDMQMCGAKKPSPCGRHDSDKQKAQETTLKQIMADAFNKMKGTNYSIADVGLPDEASAYEFLCAIFYYLDVNQDRVNHSPYTGKPVAAENRHDHRKAECWIQSTYDYSYRCKYCRATSSSPPWQKVSLDSGVEASGGSGPALVNHILNHSKAHGEPLSKRYELDVPEKSKVLHEWVMMEGGRKCKLCGKAFTLNSQHC
mgnify:CR=1 FL=1